MATFKLEHDRKELAQWDLNQRLIVEDIAPGTQVHFDSKTSTPYAEDGIVYVDIPNECLQKSGVLNVYFYVYSEAEGYTKESFTLGVHEREKPEDYDANVMFGDSVNELLGEVIEGGLADKLAYMKDCLETLYQSPPIKLMREVYGENKSLKELCEEMINLNKYVVSVVTNGELSYAKEATKSGFSYSARQIKYPNGNIENVTSGVFIAPNVFVLPQINVMRGVPFTICNVINSPSHTFNYGDLSFVSFENLRFYGKNTKELATNNAGLYFNILCCDLRGIHLPKVSRLVNGAVRVSHYCITNGIHLGQVVRSCASEWLFPSADFLISSATETPVYCYKDFYVTGTLYLEKLNIPLDCIIGIMENASYEVEAYLNPILSIGDFNIAKLDSLFSELSEEDNAKIDEIVFKMESEEITPEQALQEVKNINNKMGVWFEFIVMKGWDLQ